jgi:Zn finger protein HypA/HybF involved in hydrogenase expression
MLFGNMKEGTMISDIFEHVEDVDEDKSKLRCKGCNAEFVASFNILTPQHVEYELTTTTKMTVTCPSCGVKVRVDERRNRLMIGIAEMTAKRDFLVKELRKLLEGIDTKFMIQGDRYGDSFAFFNCLRCGAEFEARTATHPDGRLNVRVDKDNFALVCPVCGIEDEINNSNLIQRGRIMMLNKLIREINDQINTLQQEYADCDSEDE